MTGYRVGVVTALGRPEYDYLFDAAQSLRRLRRSLEGAAVHWVVCCDSDTGVTVDPREVRAVCESSGLDIDVVNTDSRSGPAVARNIALARIRAPYLVTLDSDDTVTPAGMATLLETLASDRRVGWAAGRCYHVDVDRELLWRGPPDPWPPGRVAPGEFWKFKTSKGGLPFLCTAAVARTSAIRACGGWPSTPMKRAEDTALWAVLTSRWPGVWVAEHVYNYRRHPASVTHSPGFRALDEDLSAIDHMVRAGTTHPQLR